MANVQTAIILLVKMKLNYLVAAIFAFMLITLWTYHCELDRRYMNHLQSDRLIEQAQNEAIILQNEQTNKLTDYMVEFALLLDRYKDN